MSKLRKAALIGALSVGAGQIVKVGVHLAALLILTRLLSPADFGIFAMLSPFIGLAVILRDSGTANAVIRRPTIDDEELSSVFCFNIAVGAITCLVFFLSASSVAIFFGEPILESLVVATTLIVIAGAISSQHLALATRDLRFPLVSAIEAVSLLVGFSIALGHAAWFHSVWSLWLFPFATTLTSTILLWTTVKWRPGRCAPLSRVRDIWPIASGIVISSLLDFASRTIDKVLIGRVFGPVALGLYDRTYKIVLMPLLFVNIPLEKLLLPFLSRSISDASSYRMIYAAGLQISLLIVAPPIAVAIANSDLTVRLMFGPGWESAAPLFFWLGIVCLAQLAMQTLSCVWISQGRTGEMVAVNGTAAVTAVVAFAVGSSGGLIGFVSSYAVCELLRLLIVFWWSSRKGPIRWTDHAVALIPFVIAVPACVWLSKEFANWMRHPGLFVLAAEVAASALLTLVCMMLTRPGRVLFWWASTGFRTRDATRIAETPEV